MFDVSGISIVFAFDESMIVALYVHCFDLSSKLIIRRKE